MLLLGCSTPLLAQSDAHSFPLQEKAVSFTSDAGQTVEALEGSFSVPENRTDPDSRTLTLRYVRFAATGDKPGSPIVYLAGGPGGSGIATAKGRRFDLFMAMLEFGDVIAFDQRGTGASNDLPTCVSSQTLPATTVIPDEAYLTIQKAALRECLGFWSEEGVDVGGYNTLESVADLKALRVHLGAEKLTLWGISYGSHLALAAVKEMEDRIERVVIASAEGLDQTIKLPARTDEYFTRVQQAINTQPQTREAFPDIIAMIRRVHDQLDREPIMLSVSLRNGTVKDYLWQRRDMQQAASGAISDPVPLSLLLQIYAGLDKGDTSILSAVAPYFVDSSDQVSMRPMSVLMDIASGTDSNRRALIQSQARTSLLGPFLNQPVELEDVDPSLVLEAEFRTNPVSDVPLLLLSGTLDGRTYLESQREAVAGFSNAQAVTIHNVGHNLFMASPEVTETIQEFMRGKNVDGCEIDFSLTDLMTAGFSMLR
ncbi:alpha/beta fold hydrolase [Altererythrobacter gangjinensis]|uniref:Proline iminopeptidase n=2 Tax=Pontixanthobacter gangjinensis TaxID=1028742 RepID=A0A6I4SNY7_9SPHN|nr:alpha/beta fold hydrolase [Pontixanthobacter gangjinensis]